MMKGIRLGFCYKMRSLYDHFLISVVVQDNGSLLKSKISWVKKMQPQSSDEARYCLFSISNPER